MKSSVIILKINLPIIQPQRFVKDKVESFYFFPFDVYIVVYIGLFLSLFVRFHTMENISIVNTCLGMRTYLSYLRLLKYVC